MTKFVDLFPLKEVAIENLDDLGDVDVSTITPFADQLVGYNGTIWDNSFAIGIAVGELVRLEDIGGGTPGLPAVDGSNLTGLTLSEQIGLNDLNDTTITGVANLHALIYNNGSSQWENRLLTEADISDIGTHTHSPSVVINNQVGTTYQLTGSDNGKIVEFDNAADITVTVPLESTEDLGAGFNVVLAAIGAGQVTVAPEGAVVINSSGGNLKLSGQYSTATLYKRGADEFLLAGDLSA